MRRLIHHIRRAHKIGHALVQAFGFDVEDAVETVRGFAAGLFADEGRPDCTRTTGAVCLWDLLACRINIDAAFEQIAVEIGHQRTDVAGRIRLFTVFGFAVFDVVLHALGQIVPVALVDAVDAAVLRRHDVGVGEAELADGRGPSCKAVYAAARGINQHRGTAVDHITGRHEFAAGLQKILQTGRVARTQGAVNGKDGADGHVYVNVAAAVKRVKSHHVVAVVFALLGRRQ